MLKTADIFRSDQGQRLDFTTGAVDVLDLFNNGILPSVNFLTANIGLDEPESSGLDDPFVEQADQQVRESASFMNALSSGFGQQRSQLGFERAEQPVGNTRPAPQRVRESVASRISVSALTPPSDSEPVAQSRGQSSPPPPSRSQSSGSFDPAEFTFNREARKDSAGRLRVYNPPSGDGGGAFEVAGITAKYQPREARRLRALIAEGKQDQAESEAKDFYRKRAAPFTQHAEQPGLQLQLADTVHHRGEAGLRRVLQRATGSESKDYRTLIRQLDSDPEALDKFNSARIDYEKQETGWNKSSRQKFQRGLLNRFREADQAARQVNQTT